MTYQIKSLPNNPLTNQPYQLCMPCHLQEDYIAFHADIEKLIDFWRFDNTCLPSFIATKFNNPIASLNPDANGQRPQKFQNILSGSAYATSRYKRKNDAIACFLMPQVSHNDYDEFEIFDIHITKQPSWFGLRKKMVAHKQVIDKSHDKIGFTDGRHRTRYFEFIGSKDIWVAIPKEQFDWFNTHCKY